MPCSQNVHHEPSYHAPEPVYHAPVHHAPSYHAPAAHHGPSYHAPSYAPSYGYGGASGGRGALQRGQVSQSTAEWRGLVGLSMQLSLGLVI